MKLEETYAQQLKATGEDLEREGLVKTPKRAAKALLDLTQGYNQDVNKLVNKAIFESNSDELVLVKDIEFYSLCEHHMLPFFGKCSVAYIPKGRVIGLSKIPRIVDMYARRFQIQEELTYQIATTIQEVLEPLGVAVICEAQHFCMLMRGVQKQNASMLTSTMLGVFRDDPSARMELLSLLK